MRIREKQRICLRFKDGATTALLGFELWQDGWVNGSLNDAPLFVEAVIREAMNGAKWWPPKGKK